MADPTPLDRAHAAMSRAPDDDAARLRFFERLADAELFLLLATDPRADRGTDPETDRLVPETFDLADGPVVLVFDREERLAAFTGSVAPYAALSGRSVAALLAGQGLGLGVNLGVAPSEILIPPAALDWLAAMLDRRPAQTDARPVAVAPPRGLPEPLLTVLDAKLASAVGLARRAYLVAVTYAPARPGHLLAFIDAAPGADAALAQAVGEALAFSGIDAGELDVAFLAAGDPLAAPLARHGLRFDLPAQAHPVSGPAAPGSDPARPPKLR